MLEERVNDVLTRAYLLGSDVIAQADGGTVSRLLYDGGGHTRAIVDATGQVATGQVFAYDAFGVRIEDPANPVVPATALLYRGEYFDDLLGQYQLRARNYTPQTGRMLSQDPREAGPGDLANANLYVYAAGDAVNAWDPSGTISTGELLTSFGIKAVLGRITIGAVLGTADAHFRGYSYLQGAALGGLFGAAGPLIPLKLGLALGGIGVVDALIAGEYDSALFRASTLGFGFALQTRGFMSFKEFKAFFGRAGTGKAWHHIVEQTPGNRIRFGESALQNPNNIVPLPHGASTIHAKISGFYSSRQRDLTGPGFNTVRAWLATKSYPDQYRFGLEVMVRFGGRGSPMNVHSSPASWAWPATLEPFNEIITSEEDY